MPSLIARPDWNVIKLMSLDSIGPTESSSIHFVAFQTGRIFKTKIKRNLKIAQNRRSGALLSHFCVIECNMMESLTFKPIVLLPVWKMFTVY